MKRNVHISSEKLIHKIEEFLTKEGWDKRLTPTELYTFRYALGSMKVNINNPSIIKRIGLIDLLSTFKSCRYIILSESNESGLKTDDDLKTICSKLDERIIFLTYSHTHKSNYIEQIYIYLPSKEDTQLVIPNLSFSSIGITDLIADLGINECLFAHHLQDEKIVYAPELDFSKEFFSFTKLRIDSSTVTFHYVP